MVSSNYLRLLIFLPAILIPACASSNLAFHIMYSAYKLNKQGDNIQPWCTPFPIWNQSVFPCPVPTVASWSANRFLRRQVRWSGISISFRIFHSLLWSTQSKAFVSYIPIKMELMNGLMNKWKKERENVGEVGWGREGERLDKNLMEKKLWKKWRAPKPLRGTQKWKGALVYQKDIYIHS